MKTLYLSKGYESVVDDDVFEWASRYKWHVSGSKSKQYACAHIDGRHVSLHRMILQSPPGKLVDHINGDSLDNRRCNLRLASPQENSSNRKPAGQYKGVRWCKQTSSWKMIFSHAGKTYRRSGFATAEMAAVEYRAISAKVMGEFSWTSNNAPELLNLKRWRHYRRKSKVIKPPPDTHSLLRVCGQIGVKKSLLMEDLKKKGFEILPNDRIAVDVLSNYLSGANRVQTP